ncbi:MAG: asparagine synthase C-terminal domain-containing protein, partial [Marinilabiliaceae bacterium]|nr:asparagine synthase C-terminal domain-containing protein [Marinilabiliaceae bacterium]
LSPGHYLTFSRHGIKTRQYWSLNFYSAGAKLSKDDTIERLHELLSSSVRLRLRADVEVAAYLSGGIDSSATVAYIKNIEPGVLNTFSLAFSEKDFDESSYQDEAVKYFNTNHKSITCLPGEIADLFPDVVWHSETALTRTAPTPMMMLSGLVRQNNIKVVITGEGADEMLAGYNIFREAKIRRFWARDPKSALRPLLLKKIYSNIPHLRNASPNILKMFFGFKLEETDNPFYSHLLRWNNSNHIKKHFAPGIKDSLSGYDPLEKLATMLPGDFESWDPLEKAQWLETTIFMSGYLLSSQGDRMGMANSIEGRYPFLDHNLLEFLATVPPDLKLNGLNEKYLLKELMKGKIPDSILNRPKQPYRAPIASVFLGKDAPEYVGEMLSERITKKTGIFDHESVSTLLKKIERSGTASEMDNMAVTAIISTHLLHHQFIAGNNSEYDRPPLDNLKVIDDTI